MKKRYVKMISLGLSGLLLAASLLGCGASKNAAYDGGSMQTVTETTKPYAPMDEMVNMEASYAEAEEKPAAGGAAAAENAHPAGQKLITTWDLTMNTEKYDEAAAAIREAVAHAGGYIESEGESTNYDNSKYSNFTIRIPQDKASDFINAANEIGTIVDRSMFTEDVTLEYVDLESRLTALRTEQEALLKLMEKAELMEDIITIQSELSNVNYQLENYTSGLRSLENRVSYDTVNLYLREVRREIPVEVTLGQRIGETFIESLEGLKEFFGDLLVFVIGNSVIIVIVLFVGVLAAKLVRHSFKKRADKKALKKDKNEEGSV